MIRADKTKCIKCYKCLKVCPFSVLEKKDDGFPGTIKAKPCIRCMHCAATCPTDALTFDGKKAILDKKIRPLPDSFAENLKTRILTRRSYRHFEDRPVDDEIITEVLDYVRWAPSAKNQHPTKWIVVNSKQTIGKMMDVILEYVKETGISTEIIGEHERGNNVVTGEAHTLLIAYAPNNAVNAPGDTYIAMTTAELLFQSCGIGTCWCGYLTRFLNSVEKLRELLPPLPEGNSFYASFMMGYPKDEEYIHIPERTNFADIQWIK